MDLSTVLGLVIALGALVGALLMDGGHLSSLWSGSAFLLIIGGTIGATAISFPMEDLKQFPKLMRKAFFGSRPDLAKTIDTIVSLVEKARREGLLALQNETANLDDHFLVRGIELVVDGTDPHAVRTIMETDIAFMEKRHKSGAAILEAMGGYAPTIGIIGTVMGLIHVLGNLSEPSKLGPAIAVAFLATFYGIFTANIFYLPMASKLKVRSADEVLMRELILEGVLSLQAGESPRIVREKLQVFVAPQNTSAAAAAVGAAQVENG